jgi:general stress protein 26
MSEYQIKNLCLYVLLAFQLFAADKANAQNPKFSIPRDTLLNAAREIIKSVPFCALVTIDSTGQPQVRTMNPFPLGDDMVIWFATSRKSRKVKEIKNNPKVCVYYSDHRYAKGYVTVIGSATIIDDKNLLIKKKRAYWENIPDWKNQFVLIKIEPESLDVVNYARGISGEPETNRAATLSF